MGTDIHLFVERRVPPVAGVATMSVEVTTDINHAVGAWKTVATTQQWMLVPPPAPPSGTHGWWGPGLYAGRERIAALDVLHDAVAAQNWASVWSIRRAIERSVDRYLDLITALQWYCARNRDVFSILQTLGTDGIPADADTWLSHYGPCWEWGHRHAMLAELQGAAWTRLLDGRPAECGDFVAFIGTMLVPLGAPEDTRVVFGFDS